MIRAAALLLSVAAGAVMADSMPLTENVVAFHGDWTVFVETAPRECFVATTPRMARLVKGDTPVPSDRSPVLQVTIRPDEGTLAEVAYFVGDETLRISGGVALEGKGTQMLLIPQGAWAWPENIDADMRALALMGDSAQVSLRGDLENGSLFTDVYSTNGLTEALTEAARRCAS